MTLSGKFRMRTKNLGRNGPVVPALGLGCMGMSDFYGPADENESIATIQAALDAGVNLLDTGDFYGMGHNEMLIGRALRDRRHKAFIAVKFGALRGPDNAWGGFDLRPAALKNFLAYTLRRLNTDYVDLYQPCRIDPSCPIEDTIGAIADLVKAGWVRHIGLSEAGPANIRKAAAVHPIAALQIEYSLVTRGIEAAILPVVRELGIGVTAYGVLSRGLLSGARPSSPKDFRGHFPRFAGPNLESNQHVVAALRDIAAKHNATAPQIAIAWVLSRGEDIIPILGARRRDQFHETLGALQLRLTPADLAEIESTVPPVSGTRYGADQMNWLDSEKNT